MQYIEGRLVLLTPPLIVNDYDEKENAFVIQTTGILTPDMKKCIEELSKHRIYANIKTEGKKIMLPVWPTFTVGYFVDNKCISGKHVLLIDDCMENPYDMHVDMVKYIKLHKRLLVSFRLDRFTYQPLSYKIGIDMITLNPQCALDKGYVKSVKDINRCLTHPEVDNTIVKLTKSWYDYHKESMHSLHEELLTYTSESHNK